MVETRRRSGRVPTYPPGTFEPGDWVHVLFYPRHPVGRVVEMRGPFGHRGSNLYTVELAPDEDGSEFDVSASEGMLAPAEAPVTESATPA